MDGFRRLDGKGLADLYSKNSKRQSINVLCDDLHRIQLEMIDSATELSDLSEANQVIQQIMKKKPQ